MQGTRSLLWSCDWWREKDGESYFIPLKTGFIGKEKLPKRLSLISWILWMGTDWDHHEKLVIDFKTWTILKCSLIYFLRGINFYKKKHYFIDEKLQLHPMFANHKVLFTQFFFSSTINYPLYLEFWRWRA